MCSSTGGAIGAETETAGQGSTAVNTLLGPDWPSPLTTRRHRPHGHGHIWTICAQPPAPAGAAISRAKSANPRRCPMATTIPSAALVPTAPVFTNTERLALPGFLAGYSGPTRPAYQLDPRPHARSCPP